MSEVFGDANVNSLYKMIEEVVEDEKMVCTRLLLVLYFALVRHRTCGLHVRPILASCKLGFLGFKNQLKYLVVFWNIAGLLPVLTSLVS